MVTQSEKIKRFKKTVWNYYRKHKRALSWRETKDPYKILISEVMLQQTQVSRVKDKYVSFIKRFPNFNSLNVATVGEVLSEWKGLGYNRRAVSLKKISNIVMESHKSVLPKTTDELDALPGIGEATASSIAAFAYDIPVVFIETNIRRVFIHEFFGRDLKEKKKVSDEKLFPFIEATLDRNRPREWYYALMDYGAYLAKTIENPNRNSLHYKKQAAFKGSNREIRGAIVAYMTGRKKVSIKNLLAALPFEPSTIKENVTVLAKEGFFSIKGAVINVN